MVQVAVVLLVLVLDLPPPVVVVVVVVEWEVVVGKMERMFVRPGQMLPLCL